MALIDFIQKLQKKPRYLRVQILWVSVLVVMLIIVSLWIVSLKHSLPQAGQGKESTQLTESLNEIKQEVPSLKDVFKASIGTFFEDDLEGAIEGPAGQTQTNTFQLKEIQPTKLPLSK